METMYGTVDFIQGYEDGYNHTGTLKHTTYTEYKTNKTLAIRNADYNKGHSEGHFARMNDDHKAMNNEQRAAKLERDVALEIESLEPVSTSFIAKELARDYEDADVMDALDKTNWSLAPMFPKGS